MEATKVICPSCKANEAVQYSFIKCKKCAYVIQDFVRELEPGWKLSATYDQKAGEIAIRGNRQGLEFLASVCLAVIGKHDPGGHVHLEWQMNNLLPGSVRTVIEFSDEQK